MKQPEALRLADELEMWTRGEPAAAELRRLHQFAEDQIGRATAAEAALQMTKATHALKIAAVEAQRDAIQQVVDEQAEDEGLWFVAQTAAEAYLQQELRRLHAAVEGAARAAIKAVEGEKT